jgi:hypothetical protein
VVRRELRSYDYPYSPKKNGSSLRIPVATWKCNVSPGLINPYKPYIYI